MRAGKFIAHQAAILFNIGGGSDNNVGSSLGLLRILMAQVVDVFLPALTFFMMK